MKKIFFTFCLMCSILLSCKQVEQVKETKSNISTQITKTSSGLIHTVYFWLKADTTPEQVKSFESSLQELGKIKSIDDYYWGKPAKTPTRDVTDHSYDYAINVFFKSLEDEASYQVDPDHDKFRVMHGPIFEKVIVYDNAFGE